MLAWTLVALGALIWFAVVWQWLRRPRWLRLLLALLVPVWALSPAPVEGFPGEFAPAIIVAVYEALFALHGNPGTAIAILVIGTLLLSLGILVAQLLMKLFEKRGISLLSRKASQDPAEPED